jgi:hypothetical protein
MRLNMMNKCTLSVCAFGVLVMAQGLNGQGLAYREFALRSDAATISKLTGVPTSELKTIHERPAILQDLQWRPSRWNATSSVASTDPVDKIGFSFYDDQLFRIVVDYGHDRTTGMTDADLIDAITAVYGAPVKRPTGAIRVASQIEAESGSPVARWGDGEYSVVLYRTSSYGDAFRLIMTVPALDDLARKAEQRALRLDEQDAPRREIARQKKEKEDTRLAAEKSRAANKAVFKP